MAELQFDFKKFIDDSKNVLISPKEYFTSMPKEGGMLEPILKALIYGAVAGLIGMLWSIIGLSAVAGGHMGGMIGGGIGIMILVWTIVMALVGLFVGAVIILVISAIAKGSTDFEACVRVSGSLLVLMPIHAVVSITAGLPMFLGSIITLALIIYGIFMLYHGVTAGLGGDAGTTRVVAVILAVIPALMILSAVMCASAVKTGSQHFMKEAEGLQKQMMEEYERQAPEMERTLRELEEMSKRIQQEEE